MTRTWFDEGNSDGHRLSMELPTELPVAQFLHFSTKARLRWPDEPESLQAGEKFRDILLGLFR